MFVLAASFASLLAAVSAKQSLSVEVAAPSDFTIDSLQLTTSVVNTGDETITLLKDPRTPLSSWATNTFAVANEDGATPAFTGVKVRYVPETAAALGGDQLTTLAPGEALEVSHEVGKYYNFTSAGEGSYTFEPVNVFTVVAEDGTLSDIVAETTPATVSLSGQLASSQPLASSSVGGASEKSKLSKRASYYSCTSTRQTQIASAITTAATYATKSATHLTSNPSGSTLQTTWYGTFASSRYSVTLSSFNTLKTAPSSWTYDCTCTEAGVYAYVYPDDYGYVYLCAYFWQAPATGSGSRADTIIHEGTHFPEVLGTDDWTYGESSCKSLAISNPAHAVDNADNHAFFSVYASA